MILTTSEESRLLDQRAMTEYGLPESVLMENAGASVVQLMKEKISWEDARVVIVCGSGNNGGDGFVTARYALSEGADVAVLVMGDASHMGENSLLYKNIAAKMGIPVISVAGADDAKEYLAGADIIVDALIGTGLKHHVKGSTAELITAMNDSEAVIVSVDVPSGMFSDSGCAAGAVVNADYTVALGSVKRGHVLYPGNGYAGTVLYSPIGIPNGAREHFPVKLVEEKDIYEFLPVRSFAAHKGTNGFIGIFAGSEGMAGAGLLTAQGALDGGGGKIALASVGNAAFQLAGKIPEVMVSSCGDAPCFTEDMSDKAVKQTGMYDVVALGPGLGRDERTQTFVADMLEHCRKTMVVDADALFAVGCQKINLRNCPADVVLTPHVGEFAFLTGLTAKDVEAGRIDEAIRYAKENHVVLVLKGAPTVIAVPDGRAWVNSTGNPGMAAGGMGDTLTGIIAAFIGQGLSAEEAAVTGVYLHGLAGDLLAEKMPVGYTAGDVARMIPLARKKVIEG